MTSETTVAKKLRALMMRTMPLMLTCQELEGFMVDYLDATLPEPVVSIEKLLESREASEFVRRAIDQLPERYRNVLLIRDIEGYDTKEAAALFGLTPGTVKVRLHRARAALKTLLEPIMRRERP